MAEVAVLVVGAVVGIGIDEALEVSVGRVLTIDEAHASEVGDEEELVLAVGELEGRIEAITTGAAHDSLILAVPQSEAVSGVVVASVDIDVMVLRQPDAKWLGHPVGVDPAGDLLADGGILQLLFVPLLGIVVGEDPGKALILQLLLRVQQVVVGEVRYGAPDGPIVPQLELTALHRACRDDDDTGRALGSVECGGGGVAEDGDGLDVVHIHIEDEVRGDDRPIDHEDRHIGLALKGGSPADIQLRLRIGVGAHQGVVYRDDTGDEGLDALHDALGPHGHHLLLIDRGGGAGEAILALCLKSGHHHLLEELGVFLHHHGDVIPRLDLHFLSLEADVGEDQGGSPGLDIDLKLSLSIGAEGSLLSLDADPDTGQCLTGGILYHTGDDKLLCLDLSAGRGGICHLRSQRSAAEHQGGAES